jgi:pimeloyl-ACP methyl ester carboxylesterase
VLVNPLPRADAAPDVAPAYPDVVPWGRQRSLTGTRRALPDADDATCVYAFRRWRDESGAVLRAASQSIQLEKSDVPMLVLASEFDADVPPASSRALAAKSAADFRLLRAAGHVGPLLGRNAAAVATEAECWCRDVMRAAAPR